MLSWRFGVALRWRLSPRVTCWKWKAILPTCFTLSVSPGCWASLTASEMLEIELESSDHGEQGTFLEVLEAIFQTLSDTRWSLAHPAAAAAILVELPKVDVLSTGANPDE
jgi:hypothetical protein